MLKAMKTRLENEQTPEQPDLEFKHRETSSPRQFISGNNAQMLNLQNCNAEKIVISFGSP